MKKSPLIAGAALAALLAGAAIAAPGPRGDGPPPPQTRAEVQAKVAERFKRADANGDGFVTKAEADAARAKMREAFAEKRQERKGERFAMLDKDGNGSLSKDEYLAPPPPRAGKEAGRPGRDGKHGRPGWGRMHHGGGMAMMGHWFDRADANKDGKVSLAEAQAAPLAMFDRVDTNKDGTISPEERTAAHEAMRAKWKERREAAKPSQG
ncbi:MULTISPECIES: EF-hand domain-containing protein [unclassified Sphingomonas]|uniref:EF-hand domain-containing protein n=1 Tax=unclassified Sphingomonas TaxID=196159 RepID=UPI0006FD70C3|nr:MULTISPECIES: EF-hand domain-containing protein [unclassified Sphingomonas]KQX25487.1 hypothetical protein ASD17_22135 [Sphingomonas sp. Root1294]KQY66479.1 hypothetical protein ASD39_11940 [Sphingomonas sp. Root50]KRB90203.1 hypothetical protein ASE22_15010 [Sphingomonas sp. Root720]